MDFRRAPKIPTTCLASVESGEYLARGVHGANTKIIGGLRGDSLVDFVKRIEPLDRVDTPRLQRYK